MPFDSPLSAPLAFISMPGGWEWAIIGLIAVLLFGRKLPDLARSLGQTYNQFKRGLHDDPTAPAASASAETVDLSLDAAGERPDALRAALAAELGLSAEEAERLAGGAPVVVGRGLAPGAARRAKAALEAAGGKASLS